MIIDIINQFSDAMKAAGLQPPHPILADGKKHRFSTNGKTSDKAGEYRLYPDGRPSGYFKCYRTGIYVPWIYGNDNDYTPEELAQFKKVQAERKAKEREEEEAARAEANRYWDEAKPADVDHPYLVTKQVKPHGIKQHGDKLLVPVRKDQKIQSLQMIQPDGSKMFFPGTRVKGCYHIIGKPGDVICFVEGLVTGETVHEATGHCVVVTFNAGNMVAVAEHLKAKLEGKTFVFCADDDYKNKENTGLLRAKEAQAKAGGIVVSPEFKSKRPDGATDFNDQFQVDGLESVKEVIEYAISSSENVASFPNGPIPLPDMPPVMPLQPEMLPKALRDFVFDVAGRQQSPPDFGAVATLCVVASAVGPKAIVLPKQEDNWKVVPNLWGALVGAPSTKKSPVLTQAIAPLEKIEKKLEQQYSEELWDYNRDKKLHEAAEKAADKNINDGFKNKEKPLDLKDAQAMLHDDRDALPKPIEKRAMVNKATPEKLAHILSGNPNGLLYIRDELGSMLNRLSREEHIEERCFFLEAFNGDVRHAYDTLKHGKIVIEKCILSIVGTIQPSRLKRVIRGAVSGESDDGLIQRLQLAVYPDPVDKAWEWRDEAPNTDAQESYYAVVQGLYDLDLGEQQEFHFSEEAQRLYKEWHQENKKRMSSDECHEVFQAHLGKMEKTIASLALLFELIDGGWWIKKSDKTSKPRVISKTSMAMALDFGDYLLSHSERIYSSAQNAPLEAAKRILSKRKELLNGFTASLVKWKDWSAVSSEVVTDALQILIDYGYLVEEFQKSGPKGGRSTYQYFWKV